MPTVISIDSLRRSPSAVLFEGGDDVARSGSLVMERKMLRGIRDRAEALA